MSVLTDPATCGILNSELTTCPTDGCSTGQQMRVEEETVTSQNLAKSIENMNRTRIDASGKSTATEGRRATLCEELVGHVTRRVSA